MDHDPAIGQAKSLALSTSGQQKRAHTRGHSHTECADIGLYKLHRIENCEPRRNRTTRYQLYLAYLKMCSYEDTHQRYKYIIRVRTDTIFAKPLDFHWLNWTDLDVEERIQKINNELTLSNIEVTPKNTLTYFMTTLISDKLISNIQNITNRYIPNQYGLIPSSATELNQYVKTGAYILVIRANNLYIVSRELFNLIPTLSFMYGFLKSPHNDEYWYNAENQFQSACYFSGLDVFDYNTSFEDKSLYEYDEKRYFDLEFNIMNPYMLYCLIRY